MSQVIIEVNHLHKIYASRPSLFNATIFETVALKEISFNVRLGETLGIVGESGSGKSTLAKLLVLLETPTSGTINYNGRNIYDYSRKNRKVFTREIQMVFQDPYSSINPMHRIIESLERPLLTEKLSKKERYQIILNNIERVGLQEEHLYRYPHELSGGQKQRISIARVLCLKPKVIIFDEPTSSLDVSVQARIINLINEIQKELHLTYIFISHDLSVIEYVSDRVLVMYKGELVETLASHQLLASATNPYTQKLIHSLPQPRYFYKGDSDADE